MLSDGKLYDIAKKLLPKTFMDVGLKLELEYTELEHMEHNNSNQNIERTLFQMLRQWRDKQPPHIAEQELKEMLCRVFKATTNAAALKELECPSPNQTVQTERPEVHAEVHAEVHEFAAAPSSIPSSSINVGAV